MIARALLVATLALLGSGCCDRDDCEPCKDAGAEGPLPNVGDIGFIDAFPPLDIGGTCPLQRMIWGGGEPIVDVFASGEQVLVVHEHGVALVDPHGKVLASRTHANTIETAAFDGAVLAVTDKSQLTYSGPGLQPASTVSLTEPCSDTVMVSGARLVCGGATTYPRYAYVFDLKLGKLVTKGEPKGFAFTTKHWRPMRRVPNTDDFVTYYDGSPTQFMLYRVDPGTHEVIHVCDDLSNEKDGGPVYAFDTGGESLVTQTGAIHRILGTECAALPTGYFFKLGTLASLAYKEYFGGMDDGNAQGQIVALVGSVESDITSPCKNGCSLTKIKVGTDTIVAKRDVALSMVKLVRVRYDAACGGLLVAYEDTAGLYRVDRLGAQ